MKSLIEIARTYASAPADAGGGSGGGAQPAAGANKGGGAGGGTGGALDPGDGAKGGEGGAAGDGAAKGDQKDGGQAAGASDQAEAKEGDAAGEFKVTVPEGVKVDEARLATFTDWAKEKGFKPEQASEILAFHAELEKQSEAEWATQDKEWATSLKKDPEFGGAKWDSSVAAAQKAVVKYGGPELVADLRRLGIVNLPSLARAFMRAGAAMKEDSAAVETAKGQQAKPTAQQRLAKRYDHPDSRGADSK